MGKISEIWEDIPQYEGRYQASNYGRIKSLVCHSHQSPILSPHIRNGYLEVGVIDGKGRRTCVGIHRLVAAAFLGRIPDGMQVNHIDGNKLNNDIGNLEIVTPSENSKHAYRMGLSKSSDNGFRKKIVIIKNGVIEKTFDSIRDLCREKGFDRRTVQRSLSGFYGPRYGYKFKLVD